MVIYNIFIFKRKAYCTFACHKTDSMAAVYQLKIKHDQDKFRVVFYNIFDLISFSVEDNNNNIIFHLYSTHIHYLSEALYKIISKTTIIKFRNKN